MSCFSSKTNSFIKEYPNFVAYPPFPPTCSNFTANQYCSSSSGVNYPPYHPFFSFPSSGVGENLLSHPTKLDSPQSDDMDEYGRRFSDEFDNNNESSSARVYPWMRQHGKLSVFVLDMLKIVRNTYS